MVKGSLQKRNVKMFISEWLSLNNCAGGIYKSQFSTNPAVANIPKFIDNHKNEYKKNGRSQRK